MGAEEDRAIARAYTIELSDALNGALENLTLAAELSDIRETDVSGFPMFGICFQSIIGSKLLLEIGMKAFNEIVEGASKYDELLAAENGL